MNNYQYRDTRDVRDTQPVQVSLGTIWGRAAVRLWDQASNRRGMIFGLILVIALVSFEIFNFSTTDYALTDLLGTLEFAGLRWATILAIAFCGIDFAGLARLFTPERSPAVHSSETWYLIAAWFLGATMNAMMTWWAVSLAMINSGHQIGNEILSREQLLAYVPVFVAALVWITRILIIGTFSVAGDRLFSQAEAVLMQVRNEVQTPRPAYQPASRVPSYSAPVQAPSPAPKPAFVAPRTVPMPEPPPPARVIGGRYEDDDEPVYVPLDQARPRPVATTPPPAASIRPSQPYRAPEPPRPVTRPAPKPQPAQAFSGRNENGNHNGNGHNGNGNGHSNGNGNSHGNSKF